MELHPEQKLSNCHDDHKFWSKNGEQYRNLYELADGLKRMDETTFAHHVSNEKNDFSRWISDVLADHTLAQGLAHLTDKDSMTKRVHLRIRFLELLRDSAKTPTAAKKLASPKAPVAAKAAAKKPAKKKKK